MQKNPIKGRNQNKSKVFHSRTVLREIAENYSDFNRFSIDKRLKSFSSISKNKFKGLSKEYKSRSLLKAYTQQNRNDFEKEKIHVQLWEIEKMSKSWHYKIDPSAQIKENKNRASLLFKKRPLTEANEESVSKITKNMRNMRNAERTKVKSIQLYEKMDKNDEQLMLEDIEEVAQEKPVEFCNFVLGFPDYCMKNEEESLNSKTNLLKLNEKIQKSTGLKKVFRGLVASRKFEQIKEDELKNNLVSAIYSSEFRRKNKEIKEKCSRILLKSECV